MTTIQGITFGEIKNVRKYALEENVYFADVLLSVAEGFPMEWNPYCARGDDFAPTGKWVYQQIIEGNFTGEMIHLAPNIDPSTGEPWPEQPVAQGVQHL